MSLYLRELAKLLDKERRGWRKKVVLLLDGAPYHVSSEALAVMKELDLPVCFLGPHSYNCAPAELLFAALKSTHLNVELEGTAKSNFTGVVKMILRRLHEISKS